MIDASLDYVAGSNYECVCSGSPTTFQQAYIDNMLAKISISSGSFTKADAAGGGRQVTIAAKPAVPILSSGTALSVALVDASGSTLRYTTSCDSQALVAAGTVDIPAWVITIGDPT
jgi:hypothetical protein